MPRYAFRIEYHGAAFSGWQRQSHASTVQGTIEAALNKLEPNLPSLAAAGRTDAGVHALGQVAHCDMARDWSPFRLSEALNYHLKASAIAITDCAKVAPDWHARFSATGRRYHYKIVVRRAPLVHEDGLAWHIKHPLDAELMRQGAAYLIGQHDFSAFRSSMCQAASAVKTLDRIEISEVFEPGRHQLDLFFAARSFLHNQVRSFVGTLERVGAGAWAPARVGVALKSRDRAACGPVAPPQGLYLRHVVYPEDPFSGSRAIV